MKIIWDERKRLGNLTKHGLDFKRAEQFEWDDCWTEEARPSNSGQPRLKAVGMLDGRVVAIIFSLLGREALSIISLRPAHHDERDRYIWSRSTRH